MSAIEESLRLRAENRCELCQSEDGLSVRAVPGAPSADAEGSVLVCATCLEQLEGDTLNVKHWFCLQEAAWSGVAAVQVTSWRLLQRLEEGWAKELLDTLYVPEETLQWAKAGLGTGTVARAKTVDSNGTELLDGDSVTLIKDLDVKGAGFTAKRGTLVKNIRLTDDPANVDGRVNKIAIVLKTCFLKKA